MRVRVYLRSTVLAADRNDQRRLNTAMSGSRPQRLCYNWSGVWSELWHVLESPQGDFTVRPL